MSKRYDKNLQLWAVDSPKEALMLPYVNVGDYSPFLTKSGELNLLIGKTPLHDSQNALAEAEAWVKTIEFGKCQLCFVYGIGLGYSYLALRSWLKKSKNRMVVFLEDDLGVIREFMGTEVATKLLKDSQARLHYVSENSENDHFFKMLYWLFPLMPVAIACLPSYRKMKHKKFEELKHSISFTNSYHNSMLDEYINFGGPFFFNYYQNLLQLPQAHEGTKFFGKFKNVPAIICGAGPSLEKQMKQLKGLKNKALIFGCGSAMNALNAAGILPHFGAAIDPNPTQIIRLRENSAKNVPYFYRNRVHPEALTHVKGPRLYITGCGGYDLGNWFDSKLGIKTKELEEGYNVVNLSIEIAKQLGCNPIIIAGCDLAYTGLKSYAEGVEDNVKVTISQITTHDDFDQQAIVKPDVFGHPTYTLWKWVAEADWIGDFAKGNRKIRVVNATEGGIGFPGVENRSLQECIDTFLKQDYDLQPRIDTLVNETSLGRISQKKIIRLMEELSESFKKCQEHLTTLIEESVETGRRIAHTREVPDILHSGAFALAEFELSEEIAYTYLLNNFNSIFSLLLSREYDTVRNKMPRTHDWKKLLKTIEISNKKFNLLRNTCKANVAIIRWAIEKLTNPRAVFE